VTAPNRLEHLAWPIERLGDAIIALASHCGLPLRRDPLPAPPPGLIGSDNVPLERWIEAAADALGIEAELVETPVRELSRLVRACAPSIVRLHSKGSKFLLIAERGRRSVSILEPDLRLTRHPLAGVCDALCEYETAPWTPLVEQVSGQIGLGARDGARVRKAILDEAWRATLIRRCWHLRLAPGASFMLQLRGSAALPRIFAFAGTHLAAYLLLLASWWTVGRGALEDRIDPGWLWAWALMLLTWLPLRSFSTWIGGVLSLDLGRLVKERMLQGALALEPDAIRHRGVGQLLAPVMEAEELESTALGGGLAAFCAGLELIVTAALLAASAGMPSVAALGAWLLLTGLLVARYHRSRARWTEQRLSMTHDLIERILGHRTRLCQQDPDRWHQNEDQALAYYLERSAELDRAASQLTGLCPRGWLVLGVATIAPGFVSGASSPALLAVALGAVLLSQRALQSLAGGLQQLVGAAIAWREVQPLLRAPAKRASRPSSVPAVLSMQRASRDGDGDSDGLALLEGHNLGYRHSERTSATLEQCNLHIRRGECLLLEGPSGSGKSTLLSLLSGLRAPRDGSLLVDGLDRHTLGIAGWRRRVASAPQFHENHVMMGSLAFNLLMSRSWPPRPGDLEEAEALCHKLGLGGLLSRMPAGMQQPLGETGWQLSHGERSRLFIARALLQGADLVLLDESFAALDPETMRSVGQCVLERAPSLLVIAHP
jgi:ATP-binding cassette subfamily B protein